MIEVEQFKEWLKEETNYTDAVIRDIGSRVKRADRMLEWNGEETYFFYLERTESFQQLTVSVKSQIKRSVNLYLEYAKRINELKASKSCKNGITSIKKNAPDAKVVQE